MKYKLAKILLALGIGLSLVSCAKKPEEPRSSQVKKEEKVKIGEMIGVAQMNGYFIKMTMPDLLSVYTPKQEDLDISGKLEGKILASLYFIGLLTFLLFDFYVIQNCSDNCFCI